MKLFATLFAAIIVFSATHVAAQDETPSVPWRFGGHLGLNFNMAGVGYSDWLKAPERPGGSFVPYVRNDGNGLGLYIGASAQYNFFDCLGGQARLRCKPDRIRRAR